MLQLRKAISCEAAFGYKQVAKLGPVSRAAGMDCEYPPDLRVCVITVHWKRSGHSAFLRIPGRIHILPESVQKQPPEHPPV